MNRFHLYAVVNGCLFWHFLSQESVSIFLGLQTEKKKPGSPSNHDTKEYLQFFLSCDRIYSQQNHSSRLDSYQNLQNHSKQKQNKQTSRIHSQPTVSCASLSFIVLSGAFCSVEGCCFP